MKGLQMVMAEGAAFPGVCGPGATSRATRAYERGPGQGGAGFPALQSRRGDEAVGMMRSWHEPDATTMSRTMR